jgi:soluble lytic murein transglycosylase-like protein
MLRVQDLMFPAVLLGCLTVILLTNLVSQPEKVKAAALTTSAPATGQGSDLLANFNLETIVENPTQAVAAQVAIKPAARPKAKKKSTSPSSTTNDTSNNNSQSGSSSGCSLASSYPGAVTRWCSLIEKYAQDQNLDPNLVAAVIYEESGGNPQAYSSSGAVGLMQIMPSDGLAANFTCGGSPCFSSRPSMNELFDPETNIAYGTRMLGSLYGKYGNLRDALLAYGPTGMGYSYADIVLGIYDRYK